MSTSWLILFSAISLWTLSLPVTGNMENKLINDLLKKYLKTARPLRNSSDVLNITYSFSYIAVDLDEVDYVQTLIVYENLAWHDEILNWDPALYGGIKHVVVDSRFIWTPDIAQYNTISDVDAVYGQGNSVIYSNGDVLLIRTMKSKVRCEFDPHNFPFDSAYCAISMGSWVYSSLQINLSLGSSKIDLSSYQSNSRWNLANATAERQSKVYACCPETYYTIVYTNKFVRNANNYVVALLAPSFILSVLTILLFLLPTHSSEKVTLGILLFCAFFVILLYTYSVLPAAGTTPCFAVFLMFNLIMLCLATLINALVVSLSNCESCREVPKVLRAIVLEFLAKLFCMTSVVKRNRSRHLVAPEHEFESGKANFYKLPTTSEKQPLDPPVNDQSNDELLNAKPGLESDVAFIKGFTKSYCQKMKDKEAEMRFRQGWRDVAQVINRFFCVFYILIILIAVAVNLIQIPSK